MKVRYNVIRHQGERIKNNGWRPIAKEIFKMNIKEIVSKVDNGTIEFDHELDPFFEEIEYIDAPTEIYIGHKILDTDIEVYFQEIEQVKEMRQSIFENEKTEDDLNDLIEGLNDLENQFDFDTVAFIKDEHGQKEWA